MSDDLLALIDKLKLEDITLIGFSMGGGEVVRYFSRHAGKGVTKAVLISSVTPFRLKTDSNPDGVPQEKFDATIEKIQDDRIGFIDDFGKKFFGVSATNKPVSTPLLEYYRMLCSFASPRAMQECAKAFTATDFRSEMNTVNVPTLIIHGDEDNTVPIELTSKQSAKLIPNNTLLIYKGAPHGLFYTDKEKLNADIIEFITNGIRGVEKLNKQLVAEGQLE
jgi:pimeloyl-ACP methyl ester carboxylesterase